MKTEVFTVATGAAHIAMAIQLAWRYERLNGMPLRILNEYDCRQFNVEDRPYWLKAFLFEICQPSTERVVLVDADVMPVRPTGKLPEAPFSARVDYPATIENEKKQHLPLFKNIRTYFNNGYFVATRAAEPAFKLSQRETHNPVHGYCIEQTWMNKYVDETCGVSVVPPEYCWLVDREAGEEKALNRHYAAIPDKLQRFEADLKRFPV